MMESEKRIFYRKLWGLVFPIAIQNLMTALVSASDAFMLGFVSQTSLSAVSLATQIQFVHNLFMLALTIGATTLAAQYWGKGDTDSVEEILAIVLKISMAVSVVFFIAAMFFSGFLMRIFTNDIRLIQAGIPYLRIVSVSYLFMGFSQIYLCIMKNSGRTAKSTIYGSVAVVINIGFNVIFIFGLAGFPAMGIAGAALATTVSRALELLLTIYENMHRSLVCVRLKYIRNSSKKLKKDFWHYTTPVLGNELVWGCGFTMFSVIMGHLGSDAVAANSVANILKNIIACVCNGIGIGASIIVGNELGKGEMERATEYGNRLFKLAVFAGAVSGLILLAVSPVLRIFTGSLSAQAHSYLKNMMYICTYYMIGKSVNATVIAGVFCAGGDTKFGLKCDAVTMWVILIPIGMITAFVLKLPIMVVYFIISMDEIIKLPAVYRHYKKYNWVRNLTELN
ncbi:MATE family efflux transporter [Blautia wexlerae]|jgi:putative MATE family efflux protein|uniref:MATE family efflux transporter n=2 Tax=Blautia wexlerae TaxID=418240 RepID=UPI000E4A9359|nr:MATE family efflux transporter [Blautia wexlerae]MCC2178241.1 MATE family efflux transporter [Blautia wexlerae]RHV24489.1 MATE family efflux transporter [Ruminococcus sp. OM05-7]